MYLIVGLGNPENKYSKTRHNMGFNAINKIAEECNIKVTKEKFAGLYGEGNIEGEKVILLKPQTYMNLSGESIIQVKEYYKLTNEQIIVIYDDIDLEPGNIRLRKKGSAGSHNGMKSVIYQLKTEEFPRIRIGIGSPKGDTDLIEHVIGFVSEKEREELAQGTNKAVEAVKEILKSGMDIAMNKFN